MRYLLFLLLFFPSIAFATEYRIAILDFRGVGVDDEALLSSLSDGVRTGLIKTIDTEEYLVMTRESTMQILKDMGKDASCMEGSCEVEVARNIGADYVVSGTVTLLSGTYLVTLKLHNTQTNALLSSEQIENKDALTLVKQMGGAGQQLLYEGGIGAKPTDTQHFQGGFSGQVEQEWTAGQTGEQIIVRFESIPSGEDSVVLVDGKVVCTKTPCSKSVPAGTHNVSIQHDRYYVWSETHNFDEEQLIQAELKPEFGLLTVTTGKKHHVRFSLEGEKDSPVIHSPLVESKLDEGKYTLKIDDPCYVGTKGQEYNFEIISGEETEIAFPVTPVPAGIEVLVQDQDGNDLEAEVYIDGEYMGESPNRFDVPVCSERVRVEYKDMEETLSLDLKKKELNPVTVELDLDAYRKRKERERMAIYDPMWNITVGYRQGHEAIRKNRDLPLDNGFIAFETGGHVLAASVPTETYFDQQDSFGIQGEVGVMWEQWYGEMDFAYQGIPGTHLYGLTDSTGADTPIVLSFNTFDFGFESGWVAPWPYLRPTVGLGLGFDVYTGNIVEVGSDSGWIDEGVVPYTLISTETDSEGEQLTPKFQQFFPYVGVSTGLLLQHPWWDEFPVGMYLNGGVKLNRTAIQTNFGVSLLVQIPMDI